MVILQAKDLRKVFGSGESEVTALDGVNLTVLKGEFVAIVGTSGSGKSTLLNLLGGLDVPTSGSVIMDMKQLEQLSDDELTIFRRRKIGFIFQQFNLIPMLNAWENIILPLKLDNKRVDKSISRILLGYWDWKRKATACRGSFQADSSRGWRLPGQWQLSHP